MNTSLSIVTQYELDKQLIDDKRPPIAPISLDVYLPRIEENIDIELPELSTAIDAIPDNSLSADMLIVKHRILSDLALLNSTLVESNEQAKALNDSLDVEQSVLDEKLINDLQSSPEIRMNRLVRISTRKFSLDMLELLLKSYQNIGVIHYRREPDTDIVYFNSETEPRMVLAIANAYNKLSDKNFPSQYAQTNNVLSYIHDLIEVVKSQIH